MTKTPPKIETTPADWLDWPKTFGWHLIGVPGAAYPCQVIWAGTRMVAHPGNWDFAADYGFTPDPEQKYKFCHVYFGPVPAE